MKAYKIILLGDSGCGKSSLLTRYIMNEFYDCPSTIGIDFQMVIWNPAEYKLKLENNQEELEKINVYNDLSSPLLEKESLLKFQIWDTAGSERYNAIADSYCKGVDGAIILFDLHRPETAGNLIKWMNMCYKNGCTNIIVVGNKNDMLKDIPDFGANSSTTNPDNNPQMYLASITKLITKSYGHQYFTTSAKTGNNVSNVFDYIFNEIYLNHEVSTLSSSFSSLDGDVISIEDDDSGYYENNSNYYCSC